MFPLPLTDEWLDAIGDRAKQLGKSKKQYIMDLILDDLVTYCYLTK